MIADMLKADRTVLTDVAENKRIFRGQNTGLIVIVIVVVSGECLSAW